LEAEQRVILGNRVHLAPLAGIADASFRLIARFFGAGPLISEMVSAHAMQSPQRHKLIDEQLPFLERERPLAIQIVGSDVNLLVGSACYAEKAGVDHVNLNFACPARKIVGTGKGSAMLRDPGRAFEVMKAVAAAVAIPVTVKIRSGWDEDSINSSHICELAQKAGIKAVFLHGRTRSQAFSGEADWAVIKEAVEAVDIPVVGNGDIRSAEDALAMVDSTGCAAVMVGRGALGRPWLFQQILEAFRARQVYPAEDLDIEYPKDLSDFQPTPSDFSVEALAGGDGSALARLIRLQARVASSFKEEKVAVKELRKHLIWYSRGLEGSAKFRSRIHTVTTMESLDALTADFFG
jgi:tRNA-dihydrouridine synthase B